MNFIELIDEEKCFNQNLVCEYCGAATNDNLTARFIMKLGYDVLRTKSFKVCKDCAGERPDDEYDSA